MATQNSPKQEIVDLRQLVIWTLVAAVAAAAINALLFLITAGQFAGAEAQGQPFSIGPVVFATLFQIVLGGVLLGILGRFLDRGITIWRWIAIVVLLLSLAQPFMWLGGEPTLTARIILVVMHLIAGGITIYLLSTRTRKTT